MPVLPHARGWCQPQPCPGGIPPISAGMEIARAGKSAGAESSCSSFPAVLVGMAMARGWVSPEAEQNLQHCPWNHLEHSGWARLSLPESSADVCGGSVRTSSVFH